MDDTLPNVVAAAVAAMQRGDADGLDRLRAEGYIDRRPQTGELVRGRQRMRELEAADPVGLTPIVNVRRVAGLDELWTIEARAQAADGTDWFVITILDRGRQHVSIWREVVRSEPQRDRRRAHPP